MIHISCGHEKSIGLEVLFKSFLQIQKDYTKVFTLYARKSDIELNLNFMSIPYHFEDSNTLRIYDLKLSVIFLRVESDLPVTTLSIEAILEKINHKTDILLTLPTSKNQLIINQKLAAGYTEFLRKKYKNSNLSMFFSAPDDQVLLITDHIPLSEVSNSITKELIINKIKLTLEYHKKYFFDFNEVLIAGINPHAGENGILGDEDSVIVEAIETLKSHYKINFKGPLSGDTLHFHENKDVAQLKVYMYHDQGLAVFKARNGVVGLNITLGLPFLRMSVDHGTAFELFSKNCADESGCLYMLKVAYKSHSHLNQENYHEKK